MQATRSNTVLGKRSQRQDRGSFCEQLQTPEPTPDHKRIRTSTSVIDGDGNKENVPPFALNAFNSESSSPPSARAARALRRSATDFVPSTPSRSRPSIERSSSISIPATPSTAISTLHISTPPPTPPILLPIYSRARALLRATCDDTASLPGREAERQIIYDFIHGDSHQSLYVSGSPGSGKTALVNSILHSSVAELADVQVINVNCMALRDVDALWQRLLDELQTLKKSKPARAKKQLKGREGVEALLTALHTKCVLVLDELDHIASTSQIFASFFSLSESTSGLMRVIGIANTHTLATASISASAGILTLHFAPYTSAQLLQILQSRLLPLSEPVDSAVALKKLLPTPALMLLTKKVASLTGDVRCLLEVLRGAIDLAVVASSSQKSDDVLSAPSCAVTPAHVLTALKAHAPSQPATSSSSQGSSLSSTSNSEIGSKIASLGLQARIVLLSILLAAKRLEAGLPLSLSSSPMKRSNSSSNVSKDVAIDIHQLHGYYSSMLSRDDSGLCSPASRNEFVDLIAMLEGVGLVSCSAVSCSSPSKSAKRTFNRSTSLSSVTNKSAASGDVRLGAGVWADEVLRSLGVNNADTGDVQEEEARAIWKRESSRSAKELKSLQAKANKPTQSAAAFPNASED